MTRRLVFGLILAAAAILSAACYSRKSTPNPKFKVAILDAPSGKGDKSYNDMALDGVTETKKSLNIAYIEVQPASVADYDSALRNLALDSNLIIAVGFLYADPLRTVAKDFPDVDFVIVDGNAGDLKNVKSLVFRPEEGCYLVGAVAAAKSRTRRIGFIAGMDIPIMHRFECGFVEGAKRMDPNIKIDTEYIGSTPDAFSNPTRGREIALLMFDRGVDVIFHAAGASGNGVIEAADEKGKFVIGVDSDQSYLAPNSVITSMRKRIDLAVERAIRDVYEHRFDGGVQSLGLKESGVDYVPDSKHLSPDLIAHLENFKNEIINGTTKVCAQQPSK